MTQNRSEARPIALLATMIVLGASLLAIPFFLTPPAYLDLVLRDAVFASDLSAHRVVVTDGTTGKKLTASVEKAGSAFIARIGRINAGATSYVASMDGYKPATAHVTALALQRVRANVDLTPVNGRLDIMPVDATKVDEAVAATVKESGRVLANEPQRLVSVLVPPGVHRISAEAPGFCPASRDFEVRQGEITKAILPLSPDLKDDEIARFVLGWSREPRDLDSHFRRSGTSGFPNPEHVFFAHKEATTNGGAVFARLDVDRLYPGAYETVTVRSNAVGDFEYFVHLYAGAGDMSGSGATVQVYTRGCDVRTYTVPSNCAQRVWAVTKLHNVEGHVQLTDQQRCEDWPMTGFSLKQAVQQLTRTLHLPVRQ